MRQIRIYQAGDYTVGDHIELSPEAGQHVAVVLRRQLHDSLILFCGDNREFDAVITLVQKKKVHVEIVAVRHNNRESPCKIHLLQGISKGERMELVVQKAVELGVDSITPLITERCVVKMDVERMEKKRSQWQAIAIAACEQCGRNYVPRINPMTTLSAYLEQPSSGLNIVLSPLAAKNWREYALKISNLNLLIGPEGGLSDEELDQLKSRKFEALALGPRILRTETAAITAISLLQAACGDL